MLRPTISAYDAAARTNALSTTWRSTKDGPNSSTQTAATAVSANLEPLTVTREATRRRVADRLALGRLAAGDDIDTEGDLPESDPAGSVDGSGRLHLHAPLPAACSRMGRCGL
jgi:hypothetical protein